MCLSGCEWGHRIWQTDHEKRQGVLRKAEKATAYPWQDNEKEALGKEGYKEGGQRNGVGGGNEQKQILFKNTLMKPYALHAD